MPAAGFEALFGQSRDAILITEWLPRQRDGGGARIVYVNDAFTRMSGYASAEVLGRTPRLLQNEHTDPVELERVRTALQRGKPFETELLNQRADGSEFWVNLSIAPASGSPGGPWTHWVSVQREVSEVRARQEAGEMELGTVRARLRSAFDDAPIGMAVTTPAGVLVQVNAALCALLGRSASELEGRSLMEVTHPDDQAAAYAACQSLTDGREERTRVDARLFTPDGTLVPTQVTTSSVNGLDGHPDHLVMHLEDVSWRLALEQELRHIALHDTLTGLPNRTLLLDRLRQAIAGMSRSGGTAALLYLDLDRFKEVNDSYGHLAGDRLLVELAARLQALLRPGDTAARLGGDEFTVLCVDVNMTVARAVADRVRQAVSLPVVIDGHATQVSASIGLVLAGAGDSPDELLRDADTAMYEAKRGGRDRHMTFHSGLHVASALRLQTEGDLRAALERDELRLHYQPVVDLADGRTVGWEALVRWEHPQRGLLLPVDFIPVAERSELVVEVGGWVLEQACAQAAAWRAEGAARPVPTVWVNASARQLVADLPSSLQKLLDRYGLPAAALGLEITETMMMADLPAVTPVLAELRALGVLLAIDDFGTGYSSLAYLASLPVDVVKVDASFVQGLPDDSTSVAVVTAVLALASALGLDAVVEGVEDDSQLQALRRLGARTGQGFLLGRPEPVGAHPPVRR